MLRRALDIAGRGRIYVLAALVFCFMGAFAPRFASVDNIATILRASSTHMLPAVGLTIAMIAGQIDLSFGTVLTLAGALAVGLQPRFGWPVSICLSCGAGALIGLGNGLLVGRLRVNSFIATLGTMTILQAAVNIYTKGGTVAIDDYGFGDWLERPMLGVLCPRVMVCIAVVLAFEFALRRTRPGRNLFVVGANAETAWFAGLSTTGYTVGAFVLAGALSAVGGVLFAGSLSSANPNMGDPSLMVAIAAVIIGGTAMTGGRGSAAASMVAVITLVALVNGLSCFGAQYEVQLVASGVLLAVVVLYDALAAGRRERTRGQRPELLREAAAADRPMEEAR